MILEIILMTLPIISLIVLVVSLRIDCCGLFLENKDFDRKLDTCPSPVEEV